MKEGEFKQSAVIRVTDRASDRSQKKKSNFVGFLGTNLWKNGSILLEFSEANFTEEQSVKKRQILWLFLGQISLAIHWFCTDQTSAFNVFLTEVIICSFKNNMLQK